MSLLSAPVSSKSGPRPPVPNARVILNSRRLVFVLFDCDWTLKIVFADSKRCKCSVDGSKDFFASVYADLIKFQCLDSSFDHRDCKAKVLLDSSTGRSSAAELEEIRAGSTEFLTSTRCLEYSGGRGPTYCIPTHEQQEEVDNNAGGNVAHGDRCCS